MKEVLALLLLSALCLGTKSDAIDQDLQRIKSPKDNADVLTPQATEENLNHYPQVHEVEENDEIPHLELQRQAVHDAYGQEKDASYSEKIKVPQSYRFGYEVKDQHHGHQFRHEQKDHHGNVHGRFGYRDNKGQYRQVDYVADGFGFRANVKTNEAGTANENPADVDIEKTSELTDFSSGPTEYDRTNDIDIVHKDESSSIVIHPPQDYEKNEPQSEETQYGFRHTQKPHHQDIQDSIAGRHPYSNEPERAVYHDFKEYPEIIRNKIAAVQRDILTEHGEQLEGIEGETEKYRGYHEGKQPTTEIQKDSEDPRGFPELPYSEGQIQKYNEKYQDYSEPEFGHNEKPENLQEYRKIAVEQQPSYPSDFEDIPNFPQDIEKMYSVIYDDVPNSHANHFHNKEGNDNFSQKQNNARVPLLKQVKRDHNEERLRLRDNYHNVRENTGNLYPVHEKRLILPQTGDFQNNLFAIKEQEYKEKRENQDYPLKDEHGGESYHDDKRYTVVPGKIYMKHPSIHSEEYKQQKPRIYKNHKPPGNFNLHFGKRKIPSHKVTLHKPKKMTYDAFVSRQPEINHKVHHVPDTFTNSQLKGRMQYYTPIKNIRPSLYGENEKIFNHNSNLQSEKTLGESNYNGKNLQQHIQQAVLEIHSDVYEKLIENKSPGQHIIAIPISHLGTSNNAHLKLFSGTTDTKHTYPPSLQPHGVLHIPVRADPEVLSKNPSYLPASVNYEKHPQLIIHIANGQNVLYETPKSNIQENLFLGKNNVGYKVNTLNPNTKPFKKFEVKQDKVKDNSKWIPLTPLWNQIRKYESQKHLAASPNYRSESTEISPQLLKSSSHVATGKGKQQQHFRKEKAAHPVSSLVKEGKTDQILRSPLVKNRDIKRIKISH